MDNRVAGLTPTVDANNVPTPLPQQVKYRYDHLGRRVERKVYAWNTSGRAWSTTPSEHVKYVWGPGGQPGQWLVLMELDGLNSNAALKKYAWGLDLAGLSGSVGQGGAGILPASGAGRGARVHVEQLEGAHALHRNTVPGGRQQPLGAADRAVRDRAQERALRGQRSRHPARSAPLQPGRLRQWLASTPSSTSATCSSASTPTRRSASANRSRANGRPAPTAPQLCKRQPLRRPPPAPTVRRVSSTCPWSSAYLAAARGRDRRGAHGPAGCAIFD